ncbi:hypothetical protein GCM10027275_46210 [Rhabdobacter roseus]|uniref:DUF6922 domain-containing protein n=1 Tax=Rhabdobacter roseus TaxID=1655419 RepID=A0A840U4F0_9BACT|nr:hypothetical protein [Rhabdobacter roseus]MBB5286709.1 hypothetical protein [Rhabdobacter roseus]
MAQAPLKDPNLSATAFWDVDFKQLDFEKDSLFVMDKVMNYGTWSDKLEVLRYYGLDRVKKEIVKAPYFKKPTLSFLCLILNLKETDFTAYQRRQARKSPWIH